MGQTAAVILWTRREQGRVAVRGDITAERIRTCLAMAIAGHPSDARDSDSSLGEFTDKLAGIDRDFLRDHSFCLDTAVTLHL